MQSQQFGLGLSLGFSGGSGGPAVSGGGPLYNDASIVFSGATEGGIGGGGTTDGTTAAAIHGSGCSRWPASQRPHGISEK